jgi:Tol biopolymer transport system component
MLSFDPAYSPDGKALAFVEAPSSGAVRIGQATVQRWYATHTLWVARAGSRAPSRVDGTDGASTPTWSARGRGLLYVADDSLWLLPTLASRPERIASPLFTPGDWSSFYGEVQWSDQFAWIPRR